jgi:hypothetical protein
MIYFITARDIGRVKIGYSAKPARRFSKVQSDSPTPLCLERVCDGTTTAEAALHARFSKHRIAGEWFALTPEIEAHMATLAAPVTERRARKPKAIPNDGSGPLALALIERMHRVADAQGVAASTLSARVLGSGAILASLEAGKTITLAKFEKACAMLDELERVQ